MKSRKHTCTMAAPNQRRLSGIVFLVVALSGIVWSQNVHRSSRDTLAVIGTKAITSERFARLYNEELIRFGLSDNWETRKGCLHSLVDDEILIAEAKNKKLDRTKEAFNELTRIQLQEFLNAYSEKHISPTIEVTDNDLKELFLKMNTKIKVRHLYARTKESADSLYDELKGGRGFNELAERVFTDPHLKGSAGSLGYISSDEMDPEFERTAYAMNVGEISKPVKTVHGYSIIKVDDIRRNPFVTESEFLRAKEKLRRFARKQKYEEAVRQYTAALRKKLDLRFNDPLITRLYELTQQKSLQYLIENKSFAISREDMKKTAVTSTRGTWNVNNLIDALSKTTERQRKWIHTRENFKDFIAGLFMRRQIAEHAKEENLDATPSFREHVEYAFDTFLLATLEGRLKKRINFSEDSLRSYYAHNMDRFRTQPEIRLSAILVDSAVIADSVRQSLERSVPFGELARRFSIQKLTAEYGGDLGFYRKDELGSLGTELFSLSVGQWNGPITQDGKYLFLKCTDRKGPACKSFKESSKEIEDVLVSLSWSTMRSEHVRSVKKRIHWQVHPEGLMAILLN